MSVDRNDLMAFRAAIEAARDDVPEFMDKCAVGEGVYAVKQARLICTEDMSEPKGNKKGVQNTGNYRRNFKSDDHATRSGKNYKVSFYNNLDYAKHLEYGFRSHFVPGKYLSGSIRSKYPDGFYIGKPGSFVRGHFTLRRAKKRTEDSQEQRLRRKQLRFLKQHNLDGF